MSGEAKTPSDYAFDALIGTRGRRNFHDEERRLFDYHRREGERSRNRQQREARKGKKAGK